MVSSLVGVFLLSSASFAYTMNLIEGQRELAAIGPGSFCGTCLWEIMKRIHAKPERDLPMALFTADAAAVCIIQVVRLRIAVKLAARSQEGNLI